MRKLITNLLIVPMLVAATSASAHAALSVGVVGSPTFSLSGGSFLIRVDAIGTEVANAYSIDLLFDNLQGISSINATKTDLMGFGLQSPGTTPDGSVSSGDTVNFGRSNIASGVNLTTNDLYRVDFTGPFTEGDSFDVTVLGTSVLTNVIFETTPQVSGVASTFTAVPEPSTTLMMGIAFAAMGGSLVWRRRRAAGK